MLWNLWTMNTHLIGLCRHNMKYKRTMNYPRTTVYLLYTNFVYRKNLSCAFHEGWLCGRRRRASLGKYNRTYDIFFVFNFIILKESIIYLFDDNKLTRLYVPRIISYNANFSRRTQSTCKISTKSNKNRTQSSYMMRNLCCTSFAHIVSYYMWCIYRGVEIFRVAHRILSM